MENQSSANKVVCYSCSKTLDIGPGTKIHKKEECDHCTASLHCCKMCSFYDPTAYNECREPNAERIVDKEKANFCEYFVLKGPGNNSGQTKNDLFAQANSLFKD